MRAVRAFTVVVLATGFVAAACGGGGGGQTPAQAQAEITTAWTNFFDPSIPLTQKKNIVENYNGLLPILQGQTQSAQAQSIKAKVEDITLQGNNSATVRYDIVSTKDGTALLPNASGQAVKVNGHWAVSQLTFCQLIKLADQNAKCP